MTDRCICPQFTDTGGFGIADLTCPEHGVAGTDPGDGFPVPAGRVDAGTPTPDLGDIKTRRVITKDVLATGRFPDASALRFIDEDVPALIAEVEQLTKHAAASEQMARDANRRIIQEMDENERLSAQRQAALDLCRYAHDFRSDDDPMVSLRDLSHALGTTEFDYLWGMTE